MSKERDKFDKGNQEMKFYEIFHPNVQLDPKLRDKWRFMTRTLSLPQAEGGREKTCHREEKGISILKSSIAKILTTSIDRVGDFGWPQVGDFQVAIRDKQCKTHK